MRIILIQDLYNFIMKTYFSNIIPRIQQYSDKLDNLTLLTNQHWVVLDELSKSKTVYIFRTNGELLISSNGKVNKAKWEYLGQNTLLIDLVGGDSYLFKHGFFDQNIFALKVDGKEEYAFLINESKYDGELNNIESVTTFLEKTYVTSPPIIKNGRLHNSNDEISLKYFFVKMKIYQLQLEVFIVDSNLFSISSESPLKKSIPVRDSI